MQSLILHPRTQLCLAPSSTHRHQAVTESPGRGGAVDTAFSTSHQLIKVAEAAPHRIPSLGAGIQLFSILPCHPTQERCPSCGRPTRPPETQDPRCPSLGILGQQGSQGAQRRSWLLPARQVSRVSAAWGQLFLLRSAPTRAHRPPTPARYGVDAQSLGPLGVLLPSDFCHSLSTAHRGDPRGWLRTHGRLPQSLKCTCPEQQRWGPRMIEVVMGDSMSARATSLGIPCLNVHP